MRYHYEKPEIYLSMYGKVYFCDHPVYHCCTLFQIGEKGLAIIQQRFDEKTKSTWWGEVDPWITDDLYLHPCFKGYFDMRSGMATSDVMKIKEVNTNYILFDNGSRITFDHEQDCCETNYADFEQLEDLALEYEFENDLIFEVVPENGFRFGSKGTPMFFIPCYSDQNGYYSSDIDIFYDGRHVFNVDCEERIY